MFSKNVEKLYVKKISKGLIGNVMPACMLSRTGVCSYWNIPVISHISHVKVPEPNMLVVMLCQHI